MIEKTKDRLLHGGEAGLFKSKKDRFLQTIGEKEPTANSHPKKGA